MTAKLFLWYDTKAQFEAVKSGLNQYQIVFIKETKQIYTRGQFFTCPDIDIVSEIGGTINVPTKYNWDATTTNSAFIADEGTGTVEFAYDVENDWYLITTNYTGETTIEALGGTVTDTTITFNIDDTWGTSWGTVVFTYDKVNPKSIETKQVKKELLATNIPNEIAVDKYVKEHAVVDVKNNGTSIKDNNGEVSLYTTSVISSTNKLTTEADVLKSFPTTPETSGTIVVTNINNTSVVDSQVTIGDSEMAPAGVSYRWRYVGSVPTGLTTEALTIYTQTRNAVNNETVMYFDAQLTSSTGKTVYQHEEAEGLTTTITLRANSGIYFYQYDTECQFYSRNIVATESGVANYVDNIESQLVKINDTVRSTESVWSSSKTGTELDKKIEVDDIEGKNGITISTIDPAPISSDTWYKYHFNGTDYYCELPYTSLNLGGGTYDFYYYYEPYGWIKTTGQTLGDTQCALKINGTSLLFASKDYSTGKATYYITSTAESVSHSDKIIISGENLQSSISNKADSSTVTTLSGRVDTAEGNITTLSGRVDTAESDITTLSGRVDTAESDIDALQEVVPSAATATNQLVDNDKMMETIRLNSTSYIGSNDTLSQSFDYLTEWGSDPKLESGPWYKMTADGVKACNSTTGIYVTTNDYAIVLHDETLLYFMAHGFRYQRVKDGGEHSVMGGVRLPDGNVVAITPISTTAFKFTDNTKTYSENDIDYVISATGIYRTTNGVSEYDGGYSEEATPTAQYDIYMPTTRYVCTGAQTSSTNPLWSFQYTISDSSMTSDQLAALNSGITSDKVSALDSHVADNDIHVTADDKTNWNSKANVYWCNGTETASVLQEKLSNNNILLYKELDTSNYASSTTRIYQSSSQYSSRGGQGVVLYCVEHTTSYEGGTVYAHNLLRVINISTNWVKTSYDLDDEVLWVVEGTTTISDIDTAIANNKIVCVKRNGMIYMCGPKNGTTNTYGFSCINGAIGYCGNYDGTSFAWYTANYQLKQTTISGYGITDAYTKTEVDELLSPKVDDAPANDAVYARKNNGWTKVIDDASSSTSSTWSSNKIANQMNRLCAEKGHVPTKDLLPTGASVYKNIISDNSNSNLIMNITLKTTAGDDHSVSGIVLDMYPGANSVEVWFRNSENWDRSSSTNFAIDGVTLADIGYTVTTDYYAPGNTHAEIDFDSVISISDTSVITMNCTTWGYRDESEERALHYNEYTLTQQTYALAGLTNNSVGDIYHVDDSNVSYIWDGSSWVALSPEDLSSRVTTLEDTTIPAISSRVTILESLSCDSLIIPQTSGTAPTYVINPGSDVFVVYVTGMHQGIGTSSIKIGTTHFTRPIKLSFVWGGDTNAGRGFIITYLDMSSGGRTDILSNSSDLSVSVGSVTNTPKMVNYELLPIDNTFAHSIGMSGGGPSPGTIYNYMLRKL